MLLVRASEKVGDLYLHAFVRVCLQVLLEGDFRRLGSEWIKPAVEGKVVVGSEIICWTCHIRNATAEETFEGEEVCVLKQRMRKNETSLHFESLGFHQLLTSKNGRHRSTARVCYDLARMSGE
jgi:hypothetical protein